MSDALFLKDPETLIEIYLDVLRESQPTGDLPSVTYQNEWFQFRYNKEKTVQFRSRKADFVTMIEGIINNSKNELVDAD